MPIDRNDLSADVWMGHGDIAVGGRLFWATPKEGVPLGGMPADGCHIAILGFGAMPTPQEIDSVVTDTTLRSDVHLVFTCPEALDVVIGRLVDLRRLWRETVMGTLALAVPADAGCEEHH